MNVLSNDMLKPAYDIAALDEHNVMGVENTEPAPAEADNIEFSIALANLAIPDVTPKQNDIITIKSLSADLRDDHSKVLAQPDKVLFTPILSVQQIDKFQDGAIEVNMGAKVLPEVQFLPKNANDIYLIPEQITVHDKKNLVQSIANISSPTISQNLLKSIPPVFTETLMLSSNKGVSNIGATIFVDIENVQDKISANRNEVVPAYTFIPTRTFTGTNSAFPQVPPLDFISKSLGEVNPLHQMQISIQMPTQLSSQIPSHISFSTNSVISQISDPMLEQLNAVQETLQDRSRFKPKDIIVQLSPAELGRVQIRFSFEVGEHVAARLVTENPETMVVLRQKSGLLLAQLKLGGFENIDLSFETGGKEKFSEQNSNAGFFKEHNNSSAPNLWHIGKGETTREEPKLGKNNSNYLARSQIHTPLSQIDIIL